MGFPSSVKGGGIMDESTRAKIQKLRELVWGKDIPHSTVPEYREWHEACQEILSFIDRELLSGEAERNKGCEYCRGWDSRCGANYCPMCGKRLEVEHGDPS